MCPEVEFVRNTDPRDATGKITNLEGGDIFIGYRGVMTDEEFEQAVATGRVQLRVIDPNAEPEEGGQDDGLGDLTKPELEDRANTLGVDISGAKNNDERVELIRAHQSPPAPEGVASLPATASITEVPPAESQPTPGGATGEQPPEVAGE